MALVFEMGKISARGQVAIPVQIRKEMGLHDGSQLLFMLEDNRLMITKVNNETWDATRPLTVDAKILFLTWKDDDGKATKAGSPSTQACRSGVSRAEQPSGVPQTHRTIAPRLRPRPEALA